MTKPVVAYLASEYPAPTHTFIRREIAGLEAEGFEVRRYAVRRSVEGTVHTDDADEAARVRAVVEESKGRVLRAVLGAVLAGPGAVAGAFALAVRMSRRSGRGLPVHLAYLVEACVIRAWAGADGVEHLHAHFGTNTAAVALLCRRVGGPRFSFTVHGPEEFDQPQGLDLRSKVGAASFVVAITEFARSQLYRWARPEDWGKVHVVHCGVDAGYLDRPHVPVPDVARLVSVGRLDPQKGQLLLVEAVARLLRAGRRVELVVIGDGPMRSALEAAIAAGDHGESIVLAGWMDNAAVAEEMLASRALVLPSFAEGLPVVIMEALALGRPVVSTAIAGIPELVQPGVNGWLVPAGSVDALVDAMTAVLDAPVAELDRLGRSGAALVAERHDARREAAALGRLIESAS
jgi:glycosyltransferase involved in cell wall biosynthesis